MIREIFHRWTATVIHNGMYTRRSNVKRFSNSEISAFCEGLAMLIDSGVPEEEAVGRMAEDGKNLPAVLAKEKYDMSLSQAFRDGGAFPDYMVDMTEIGESTGRLGDVLIDLAEYYERQGSYEDRIASLIFYPSILMFILSAILLYIAVKVFPVFSGVYANLGGVISGGTAGMITFATIISWVLCAVCLAIGVISVFFYMKWNNSVNKQDMIDSFKHVKFTSKIVYEVELARFTSAVSNYYSSGIDIESAMTYALKLVRFDLLREKLQGCINDLEEGSDVVKAFRDREIYASANNRILLGAYTTGKLNEGWNEMSEAEWSAVDASLREVTDSVEPVATLVLAVVIGLLLVSIMLPLIGIMTSIA